MSFPFIKVLEALKGLLSSSELEGEAQKKARETIDEAEGNKYTPTHDIEFQAEYIEIYAESISDRHYDYPILEIKARAIEEGPYFLSDAIVKSMLRDNWERISDGISPSRTRELMKKHGIEEQK